MGINTLDEAVKILDDEIKDPRQGLPEDIFLFASRITPMVNVDLLIRNERDEVLLTWRGGNYYAPGWHVPGGIIRYKESMYERIEKVAQLEFGAKIHYEKTPILVNEIIRCPERKNRGHFISFLFDCQLISQLDEQLHHTVGEPQSEEWMWHKECPVDIIPVHLMYKEVLNGEKHQLEITIVISDSLTN